MIRGCTNCESHIVVSYNNSGRIRKERNGTCYPRNGRACGVGRARKKGRALEFTILLETKRESVKISIK